MYINVYKGRVGERLLRRVRYMLYARIMRFPLPHFKRISQGETIPMITSEVEPLGGFTGDAFSLPAQYGGLAITALVFIFMEDPILGAASIMLYPFQAYVIPRLQRQVNRLAKMRVKEVRGLAERLTETIQGAQEIHAHNTAHFHLSEFSERLGEIFYIRFQIYNKKFFIKFLNNFLAQLTPFFFYAIGGYFVIRGDMEVGALVAVINAYKDLPPNWKELLNFYQVYQDVRVKYEQVISQFEPPGMMPEEKQLAEPAEIPNLRGDLQAVNVSLQDDDQVQIVSSVNTRFGLDQHVAVVGSAGSGKEELLYILARLLEPSSGRVSAGAVELAQLPEAATGRRIGFVAQNAFVFSTSLRGNILYGLKHRPVIDPPPELADPGERRRWLAESVAAGNSPYDILADWVDYGAVGANGPQEAVTAALRAAAVADLSEDVYLYGLRGSLDPARQPEAAARVLAARNALTDRLKQPAYANLVERFVADAYNTNATVGENLIFGSPIGKAFDMERLAEHPYVLEVLDQAGLTEDILVKGHQLAATMIELFADLPPDHELFQRFSFIGADDLPEYQALIARVERDKLNELKGPDRVRLLSLPFKLIAARHRVGLIDEAFQSRVLEARHRFRAQLPDSLKGAVEFFDLERYSASATLQDNILFGKVAYGVAHAQDKIGALIGEVVQAHGLRDIVMAVGLEAEAGIGGARLSVAQRQKLAVARNVMKRPDVLFLSEATSALDSASQTRIRQNLRKEFAGRGLVWSLQRADQAKSFDRVIVMRSGTVVQQGTYEEVDQEDSAFRELLKAES
jgi:ABC-type multidrug transport system fused ATPase/permease subunit